MMGISKINTLAILSKFVKSCKVAIGGSGIFIGVGILIASVATACFAPHDYGGRLDKDDDDYGSGSSGGGGGCFSEDAMVWTKNETQSNTYAKKVSVIDLIEGTLVGTLDLNPKPNGDYKFSWTRLTDVTFSDGPWDAYTFVFSDGSQITVTSSHLMITSKNRSIYFLRAENVQIGDVMIYDGHETRVKLIQNISIPRKVSIETEDGTILANGILVSGLCDYNPEVLDRTVVFNSYVTKYKLQHFGKEYFEMCMDTVAWKNSYHINNAFYI